MQAPPPNTWENGKLTVPQSVLSLLSQQGGNAAPGAQGAPPQGGGLGNWSQYLMSDPALMAEWNKLSASPKNPFKTPDEYAQFHFARFGKGEGRQGPPGAASVPLVDPWSNARSGSQAMPGVLGLLAGNAAAPSAARHALLGQLTR